MVGWSLWAGGPVGWGATQAEPLAGQPRKCLLPQATGLAWPGAAPAKINPVTMRGGGPVDEEKGLLVFLVLPSARQMRGLNK